ncbi:MAG: hypothetical protein ACUVS1_12030, partial [Actinomycetota bacterium]
PAGSRQGRGEQARLLRSTFFVERFVAEGVPELGWLAGSWKPVVGVKKGEPGSPFFKAYGSGDGFIRIVSLSPQDDRSLLENTLACPLIAGKNPI